MRANRLAVYILAAAILILSAGCGWQSGESFVEPFDSEAYNPTESTPITAVQAWFKSMEWKRTPDEEGELIPNPEEGRDFDLYLTVINPEVLEDPNGQFIGQEQLDELQEMWNSDTWQIEFLDLQLEEISKEGNEATVKITNGSVRYIGDMFGSPEWKQDGFKDKQGEIYLQWYEDPIGDPLQYIIGFEDVAGKGRWIVVGGLDLSEDESWGPDTPSET